MNPYRILATTAAIAALALTAGLPAHAADAHSHGAPAADAHAAAPHALTLNQGKRWVTDAPLRRLARGRNLRRAECRRECRSFRRRPGGRPRGPKMFVVAPAQA